MKFSTLVLATLTMMMAHSAIATNYYRWVDKNGSTHYTTTPPPKGAKLIGKTETYAVPVYQPATVSTTSSNYSEPETQKVTVVPSPAKNLAVSLPQNQYNNVPVNQTGSYVPAVQATPSPVPATIHIIEKIDR